MPIWPYEFEPQQNNLPFFKIAHVCKSPAATDRAEPGAELSWERHTRTSSKYCSAFLLTKDQKCFEQVLHVQWKRNMAFISEIISKSANLAKGVTYWRTMTMLLYFLFPTDTLHWSDRRKWCCLSSAEHMHGNLQKRQRWHFLKVKIWNSESFQELQCMKLICIRAFTRRSMLKISKLQAHACLLQHQQR